MKLIKFFFVVIITLSLSCCNFMVNEQFPISQEKHKLIKEKAKLFAEKIIELVQHKKDGDILECMACELATDYLYDLLMNQIGRSGLYEALTTICSLFIFEEDVCEGAIRHYGDIVLDNVIKRFLGNARICVDLELCENTMPLIKIEDYAKRVLADMPEIIEKKIDPKSTEIFRALQVNDIHFDRGYKEGTIVNCNKPLCCRDLPTEEKEEINLAGFFGSIGNCDANFEIVKSFTDQISRLDYDFIIFNGDNIAHEVWNLEQEDVIEATRTLIDTITAKIGYDIPIFPAIGNHEKAPVDQFGDDEHVLLEGMAEIFKPWLNNEAYETFKKYGYYSMKYKDTNLRIISLNCLMCDAFNWNLLAHTEQPKKMFDWFEEELRKAENANEFVHVLDHIPLGNYQQNIQCGLRIKILMERFQNIIRGYYSAHTHQDQIKIVRDYSNNKPINVDWVAGGLTTYSEYNPSFRIYDIDTKTMLIKDFTQYRFNLKLANEEKHPYWFESYKAYEFLNNTNLYDAERISKINIAGDYIIHQHTDTDRGKEIAYDPDSIKGANCSMNTDTVEDSMKCDGTQPGFSGNYLFYIMSKISGLWKDN